MFWRKKSDTDAAREFFDMTAGGPANKIRIFAPRNSSWLYRPPDDRACDIYAPENHGWLGLPSSAERKDNPSKDDIEKCLTDLYEYLGRIIALFEKEGATRAD